MKKGIVVAALILVSGCAGPMWMHDTKGEAEFEIDRYECEQQAIATAANLGAPGNPFTIASEQRKCMRARGWKDR